MQNWSSALWLVQTSLNMDVAIMARMYETLGTFGLSWGAFPLRPFACDVPVFPWDGKVIYYGSTRLVQAVNDDPVLKANAALFYDRETHSVAWYGPRFGADYLNAGATRMTAAEVLELPDSTSEFFCRPEIGIKLFSGKCMDKSYFRGMVEQGGSIGDVKLDLSTPVYVNDLIQIEKEFRTWWIDGKIAAIVGYRQNGRVIPWVVDPSSREYEQIEEFALDQGMKIREIGAVVLDVAITEKGLKVVEINTIHSSGFYQAEIIPEVVCELTNYVLRRNKETNA